METQNKICTICKSEKSLNNFNKKKNSKDGYQNVCKTCNALTSKKHYENNKEKVKKRTRDRERKISPIIHEFVLTYLRKGCVDCGEKDIIVLDFDHLENKEKSIGKMIGSCASLDKLKHEIEKCEVRCSNCHRRKTAKDFNWWRLNY